MQRPLDYYGPGENTGIWVTPSAPAVSTCRRADIQTTLGLSLFFTHSCALFCSQRNLNSFLFKWFRTLWGKKHRGWGTPPSGPTRAIRGRADLNDYTARHALEYSACGGTLGLTSPRMAGPNRKRAADAESGCHSQRQLEATCFRSEE